MNRFYVGIDPSYTNTGIAIADPSRKEILLTSYGDKIGDKAFMNLYHSAVDRVEHILSIIQSECKGNISALMETPPPSGSFGSGLYGLDYLLAYSLRNITIALLGVAPTYVGHIHGTRNYTKTDSVKLAKDLFIIFTSNDYVIKVNGRLSNDMAEAFLFMCRLFVINSEDIADSLVKRVPNYKNKKEFNLR